jgi:hypothetical protein
MSQQGITDPEGFVADETSGFLLGALLVPVVFALIFIMAVHEHAFYCRNFGFHGFLFDVEIIS